MSRLALTMGDPHGIGPEVVLKTLANPAAWAGTRPCVVGSVEVLNVHGERLDPLPVLRPVRTAAELRAAFDESPFVVPVLDVTTAHHVTRLGQIDDAAGALAMRSLEAAIALCQDGTVDALVTAPISKEAIARAGYTVPGHTEFLAEKTGGTPLMLLATEHSALTGGPLRVGLVTAHIPLAAVAARITAEAVGATLRRLDAGLRQDYGLAAPRLAVLGLNPHAGDGGVLGHEERDILGPALDAARAEGLHVSGPFPADGFFGQRAYTRFDAVLALYHDQGLAPFKALAMGGGVNITLGLPIVRTSPDHGTAFGLAGRGTADPASFTEALQTAARIAQRRARG